MSIRRKMLKVGFIKEPSDSEQLPDSNLMPNSDLSLIQNSDLSLVQNSDTPLAQNSDTPLAQNSDTPLAQKSDTTLAQKSDTTLAQNLSFSLAPFPNISVYRKYSAFRSSRFKVTPRTDKNQRPVLPLKRIIDENISIRRLVYLHTGRCTERLPNQDSVSRFFICYHFYLCP
uniref:Uncharacterized protein n=1 Tax=Schizaphis graminum TaxID=13262 RepID=A0A2S2NLJ3_SCHGA